jgi:hypothetical protein
LIDYETIYHEARLPGIRGDINHISAIAAVVAAAKAEALEEALIAVNGEQLEDDTGHPEDSAYRSAIVTAAGQIELLIQARLEKTTQ